MTDFLKWMREKNTEAFNQYTGPRVGMTSSQSFADFTEFLNREETKESVKRMLAHLSLGIEIAEDCHDGEVDDRAVLHFTAAFTIAYYPDEEFFLTKKDFPDNAQLIERAKEMLGYFEQVLVLFASGRLTVLGHFASSAREYFKCFRQWLPRDRVRVVKLTSNLLVERHIQGLPETDPFGSLLREYLRNAGGQMALDDLDCKKAALSMVFRSLGLNNSRELVSLTERDGSLVVRIAVAMPAQVPVPLMVPAVLADEQDAAEAALGQSGECAPTA